MNRILLFSLIALVLLTVPTFAADGIAVQDIRSGTANDLKLYITNGNVTMANLTNGFKTLDLGSTARSGAYTLGTNITYIAQNISVDQSTPIDGFIFQMNIVGSDQIYDGNVTVRLETQTVAGKPSGTLVDPDAWAYLNGTDIWHNYLYGTIYTSAAVSTFVMQKTIVLNSTTPYWIVIRPNLQPAPASNPAVVYSTAGNYLNGTMAASTNAGTTWTHYAAYDFWFQMINRTYNTSQIPFSSTSGLGTLHSNWSIAPTGTGKFQMLAGDKLVKNMSSTSGNSYGINFYDNGGGTFEAKCNYTNQCNLTVSNATNRAAGVIYQGQDSVMRLDYINIEGHATTTVLSYASGYSQIIMRGGSLRQKYTSGYIYTLADPSTLARTNADLFYGVDFVTNSSLFSIYQNANLGKPLLFVNCHFQESSPYAFGVLRQMGNPSASGDASNTFSVFAGCRRNNVAMNTSAVYFVLKSSTIITGNLVSPKIINLTGSPVADAVVTTSTQFNWYDDMPMILTDYDRVSIRMQSTWFYNMMNVFPKTTNLLYSNASGDVVDELGLARLWIPDRVYTGNSWAGITGQAVGYFGGSGTSLRSLADTTWANNGADEGAIITYSHANYGGNVTVVNPNTAITGNITLGCNTTGGGATPTDTTKPLLKFVSQHPSDITTTNILNTNLTITYSINDTYLNPSTVELWYKSNSSISNIMFYQLGTSYSGFFKSSNVLNVSDKWNFTLQDNSVYPATYNYGEVTMESTLHASYSGLTTGSRFMKMRLYNISTKTYSFLELNVSTQDTAPLNVWFCNNSYVAEKVETSGNCEIFYSLDKGDFDHTHDVTGNVFSSHRVIPFAVNNTTGYINNVLVSGAGYFLVQGINPSNVWDIGYISGTIADNPYSTTTSGGTTWTAFNGIVDMHLHQYNGTDTFYYYACANDTYYNNNCSSVTSDLLDQAILPPSAPFVYIPNTTEVYGDTINIYYTPALSPMGYGISFYNLSLYTNDTTTLLQTIVANNSLNLNYSYNILSSWGGIGNFTIGISVTDMYGYTSHSFSEEFTTGANVTYTTTPASANNSVINVRHSSSYDSRYNKTLEINHFVLVNNTSYANLTTSICTVNLFQPNGTSYGIFSLTNYSDGNYNTTINFTDTVDGKWLAYYYCYQNSTISAELNDPFTLGDSWITSYLIAPITEMLEENLQLAIGIIFIFIGIVFLYMLVSYSKARKVVKYRGNPYDN